MTTDRKQLIEEAKEKCPYPHPTFTYKGVEWFEWIDGYVTAREGRKYAIIYGNKYYSQGYMEGKKKIYKDSEKKLQ
ncbi:hypothetical protein PCC7424_5886 (plasmid) [Gloeothece citriformis PCC 7424]|uniref:Uncharacterized protein n=1 Tax=Gloeothece citriformis (strain PCC 7424) TaxID=65393 RepID=B7KMB1_GLOC7|nr:hypothetical protein [Gloeothece citriformis]ACK73933.1 hypothetical protein PCC7424_5886 [Gloeothece citriformis PCC 7424]